jgi:excisionase family DNA binding protein
MRDVELTTRDVAGILDVTRQRVRQLADSSELPAWKDDLDRWRFDRADVEALKAKRAAS